MFKKFLTAFCLLATCLLHNIVIASNTTNGFNKHTVLRTSKQKQSSTTTTPHTQYSEIFEPFDSGDIFDIAKKKDMTESETITSDFNIICIEKCAEHFYTHGVITYRKRALTELRCRCP